MTRSALLSLLLEFLLLTQTAVFSQETFSTKLFTKYGYSFNNSVVMSVDNLTALVRDIVDGRYYDASKTVGQESSNVSQVSSIIVIFA